ncbi:thioesterase family protein [Gordonia sp. VNK21]|uniref:thioesterase family protein n=1 Tax=Gordonia sp. VNK21 TaxID=3382483 RepID=UPI0038D49F09
MAVNEAAPGSYYRPIEAPAGDPPAGGEHGYEYFQPTEGTISVWSPRLQHGGPPSGLLTRAMSRLVGDGDGQAFSRITVDILGAVGLDVNRVRAWVARPGRQISLVAAELEVRGTDGTYRAAARASAWRLRASDSSAVQALPQPPLTPLPDELPQATGFPELGGEAVPWGRIGFIGTLSVASVPSRNGGTPPAFWLRPQLPLVAGERATDLESAMTVLDVANGVGTTLDPRRWSWMNTDTTVHLVRQPAGPWLGVDADMAAGADGYAASLTDVYDLTGFLGRSAQTALLSAQG